MIRKGLLNPGNFNRTLAGAPGPFISHAAGNLAAFFVKPVETLHWLCSGSVAVRVSLFSYSCKAICSAGKHLEMFEFIQFR